MAFRRGAAPRRRFARKPKDLVWVTTLTENTIPESTLTEVQLVSAGTWEANANNFERATLLRIVGYISIAQSAASTSGEPTGLYLAIAKQGLGETANFDPGTAGDYDVTDVMWCYGVAASATAQRQASTWSNTLPVDIRVKRKLDSSEKISLFMIMGSDAATPAWNYQLCLRALINRA